MGTKSLNRLWNKTCRYRACLLSASPSWRSGRSQGGVERGKGRTTLTANVSRYIRARGTPVPRRDSATASRDFSRFSTTSPSRNEDRNTAPLRLESENAIDWGSLKGQSIAVGPRGPGERKSNCNAPNAYDGANDVNGCAKDAENRKHAHLKSKKGPKEGKWLPNDPAMVKHERKQNASCSLLAQL